VAIQSDQVWINTIYASLGKCFYQHSINSEINRPLTRRLWLLF